MPEAGSLRLAKAQSADSRIKSWETFTTDGSCLLQIPHESNAMWKSLLDSPHAKSLEDTRWESFMVKPNGRLVRVSYTHYCASTSRLSKS
jgi:hypothetical protein